MCDIAGRLLKHFNLHKSENASRNVSTNHLLSASFSWPLLENSSFILPSYFQHASDLPFTQMVMTRGPHSSKNTSTEFYSFPTQFPTQCYVPLMLCRNSDIPCPERHWQLPPDQQTEGTRHWNRSRISYSNRLITYRKLHQIYMNLLEDVESTSCIINHSQGLTLTPPKCGWISDVAGNSHSH